MTPWKPTPPTDAMPARGMAHASALLAGLVESLGRADFAHSALARLSTIAPLASLSVYRIGSLQPRLFMSASQGVPDTTRQCWSAYLSGPQHEDRSWGRQWPCHAPAAPGTGTAAVDGKGGSGEEQGSCSLVHVQASEVTPLHRQCVYEAHGVAERISIAERGSDGSVFAVNFYRHAHQKPFSDRHLSDFADLSAALMALTRKHIALTADAGESRWPQRLRERAPGLTARELDVCLRLLRGMTLDGIAADLQLSAATAKTYRNRAFARLDIHHRHQLFALMVE